MPINPNSLYYGDCLDWMEQWGDRTVDLIYLDPPFNSQQDYNVLYTDKNAGAALSRLSIACVRSEASSRGARLLSGAT